MGVDFISSSNADLIQDLIAVSLECPKDANSPYSMYGTSLQLVGFDSGVARGVAGVAEATPIIQFLFNKFGQKIRVKRYRIYCGLHQFQNPTYLPAHFYHGSKILNSLLFS